MDDTFELLDPHNAQAFLKQLSSDVRRKGETCFCRGCVQDLVPEEPGVAYSARVKDGELHYSLEKNLWHTEGYSGELGTPSWKEERLSRFLKKIYSDLFEECEALVVETYLPSWLEQEGLHKLNIPYSGTVN